MRQDGCIISLASPPNSLISPTGSRLPTGLQDVVNYQNRALVLNINKRGLVASLVWEIILHQDLVTQTVGDPVDMGNCSQAPGKLFFVVF